MSEQQLKEWPTCGIEFWIPKLYAGHRQDDGTTYYCPNGHGVCAKKPEVRALREQVADLTKKRADETAAYERGVDWWRERLHDRDRQIISLRGAITKMRKRLGLPKARRRA